MRRASLAVFAVAVAGCVPATVRVTPTGSGLVLAPRPDDCQVEFYRTKRPDRPYDEVGAMVAVVNTATASGADAQEAFRKQACALGADAVIVTQELVFGTMSATAIGYRDVREQHRADWERRTAEQRKVEAAAREQYQKELAAKGVAVPGTRSGPPDGYVLGRVKEPITARTTPDRRAPAARELSKGELVWIGPKPSAGWRRIWAPGESAAWVEEDALDLTAAPKAPGGV